MQVKAPTRTLRAREADAESILELWDFRRAQERTAQRDAAATREAERDAATAATSRCCLLDNGGLTVLTHCHASHP